MTTEQVIPRAIGAKELLQRREARSSLLAWYSLYAEDRGWIPAAHHKLLVSKLQAAVDGTLVHSKTGKPCRNLMVLMPPGSAKSVVTSIVFPAWYAQRFEDKRILACSHSADLIEGFSQVCRNTIETFSTTLGIRLQKDSKAVQLWTVSNGTQYKCAGVGAGLAGYRADILLIDDYIGSEEDADSKTVREKQWLWYENDVWPRLKPNAIQIIVANRRHEEDLVGMLLAKEASDWEVIRIPFFAEDNDVLGRSKGERLWPEWFTEKMAEGVRQKPARTQAGLYQQRPAPEDGDFFKSEMIQTYTRDEYDRLMGLGLKVYGAADWAVSEKKDSNYTCIGGCVLDQEGTLYILPDIFWKIAGPKEVTSAYLDFLKRRNPIIFWSEKGHISSAWGPFFKEMMLSEGVYSYISEVTVSKDKETRAQAIRGRMSMLRVKFPSFAHWWPDALSELLSFPSSKAGHNDDFVDMLAHLGRGVLSMTKFNPTKQPEREDINKPQSLTLTWLKKEDKKRRDSLITSHYQGR